MDLISKIDGESKRKKNFVLKAPGIPNVTHLSTDEARRCLTSGIKRDLQHTTRFGLKLKITFKNRVIKSGFNFENRWRIE